MPSPASLFRRCGAALVVASGLFVGAPARAAAAVPAGREGPARALGLALGGGGARGIAHIGVLQAIEERGLAVDAIAGTSMGAVVGALFASGYTAGELRGLVERIDWDEMFRGRPDRRLVPLVRRREPGPPLARLRLDGWRVRLPRAALSDVRINRFLIELLSAPGFRARGDFDALPIPFRAVAADLRTGEPVVLGSGSLPRAVRASLSIPVAFPPVRDGERVLVDGGIANNLPVDVVRAMGAERVVAVDVSSPPLPDDRIDDVVGVARRLTDVLVERNQRVAAPADVTIRPDLGDHGFTDYGSVGALIEAGYRAALAALNGLDGPRRNEARRPSAPGPDGLPLRALRVEGLRRTPRRLVERELGVAVGESWSTGRALAGLDRLHGTGLFESLWLDVAPAEGGGVAARVVVEEAPPREIELGAGWNDEDKARAFVHLHEHGGRGRGALLVDASDRGSGVAARWQGVRPEGAPFGVELAAALREDKPRRFDADGAFVNRAEFDRRRVSAGTLLALGSTSLVRLGARLELVRTRERLGLSIPAGSERRWTAYGGFVVDALDRPTGPFHGTRISVEAERNLRAGPRTPPYWRASARWTQALELGPRASLVLRLAAGAADRALPPDAQFRIGGPELLPGLHRDELWGDRLLGAALALRRRIRGPLSGVVRVGVGGVGSVGVPRRFSATAGGAGAGFDYDSPLGPVRVELGFARGRAPRLFVSVGFE